MKGKFSHPTKNITRILEDVGQALDDYVELANKNSWKAMKVCYGPGMYQLVIFHPDLSRIVLKSGMEPKLIACLIFM